MNSLVKSTLSLAARNSGVVQRSVLAGSRTICSSIPTQDTFKDREAAEENIYIRQQEERMMKKLVEKLKFQQASGERELKQILGQRVYDQLGEDTIHKLIDWKFH
ncbi:unnamed protein product [Heterosigma akashiwo]|uniref:Uncharacterized protein n=1 Tax=Heterosigma akashiwo TaxID=2829 RepID=A0A6V1NVF1_HETAK|mmetsp:Transcript_11571/g.16160  ORF Transcript_11571/g.16160 Transcript_11571/m.16160 type:complete len:105 (-) Transcript_11571:597-911(-)